MLQFVTVAQQLDSVSNESNGISVPSWWWVWWWWPRTTSQGQVDSTRLIKLPVLEVLHKIRPTSGCVFKGFLWQSRGVLAPDIHFYSWFSVVLRAPLPFES
jgi:hypothetical protein